ncbi:MAG: branched-chain amino acid ABC transporter permease [Firmicutes bacterium]|jgi:branched-chain amino acid transport system permease protein|nr:branched-chain amino acid ABC transporter permease [Bacillota bacterium]
MSIVIQQLINGLALGCAYGLIALGYSFIWNAVGLVNLAQGSFVMVGAFVFGVTFTNVMKLPFLLAFVSLIVVMAAFGMVCEWLFYRPLKRAHIRTVLVSLVALGMLLGNLALIVWGPYPQGTVGPFGQGLMKLSSVSIPYQSIFIIVVTLLLLGVQTYLFKRTTLGKVLRAVAQDKDTASLMGIDADLAVSMTFAYSSILGGIAGMMIAPIFVIAPSLSALGFKGFGACIVGSFGELAGAFAGGLILGVCEIFGASYISSLYKEAIVYIVIIGFLLFRPEGLFGKRREQSGL